MHAQLLNLRVQDFLLTGFLILGQVRFRPKYPPPAFCCCCCCPAAGERDCWDKEGWRTSTAALSEGEGTAWVYRMGVEEGDMVMSEIQCWNVYMHIIQTMIYMGGQRGSIVYHYVVLKPKLQMWPIKMRIKAKGICNFLQYHTHAQKKAWFCYKTVQSFRFEA